MATKVKPSRLNITWTPQAWDVPMYVDADNFQWWAGGSGVTVVDNLNSQSGTDALSANQWYILNNKIADLFGLGKFLSVWDATTGQPDSFPLQTPYTYSTWDYYLVGTVSSATPPVNYRPNGSSYTWTASSTPETDELEVWDIYIYDWSTWLLQSNHGKTVSFANLAWDAMDNVNLSGYLNVKAFYLSSTSDLTTAQAAFEWQNGGKTAIVVYSNKPYAFSFYNTAQMDFACLFYREQLEAGNNKTSLVRDVITFSVTWGTTVSSISANGWNNVIASVLKTDTNYTTPYTPQYDGSPATKKYVDDSVNVKKFTYPSVWNNVIDMWSWIANWKPAVIVNDSGQTITTYVINKYVNNALWWGDDEIYASAVTDAWVISLLIEVSYVDSTTATVTSVTASSVGWTSTITVTLTSAWWSSKTQTVSATGVTASNTVIVSPVPSNINDYASNSVYCSAQWSWTLTFSCNTEPSVDIVVNVVILS